MASRHSPTPESMDISDSEDVSLQKEKNTSEANNRRLRQAISYIATEGGSDSLDLYADRVQIIDNAILQEYANEEYSFDPKLYRQLRAMVREAQTDFEQDERDPGIVEDFGEEDSLYRVLADSVEYSGPRFAPKVIEALGEEEDDYIDPTYAAEKRRGKAPERRSTPASRTFQTSHSSTALAAKRVKPTTPVRSIRKQDSTSNVRAIMWRYGGPNNDLEEYHQNFPASLPFGETLYMQELESMRIDFDLTKSAKRKTGDKLVTTNVPYNAVQLPELKSKLDSGSRYKLPEVDATYTKWERDHGAQLDLKAVIERFNKGGLSKDQQGKDYAPRLWLPKVFPNPHSHSPVACPPSTSVVQRKSSTVVHPLDTTTTGRSSTRRTSASLGRATGRQTYVLDGQTQLDEQDELDSFNSDLDTTNAEIRRRTARYGTRSIQNISTPSHVPANRKSHMPAVPHVASTPAEKRGPRRPRKTVALPLRKRKLSDGSRRFFPEKKGKHVTFEEELDSPGSTLKPIAIKQEAQRLTGGRSPTLRLPAGATRSGGRFKPIEI